MSRQNVEIVRRAYEAYEQRDAATLESLTEPDLVWELQSELPDAATLRGPDEVLAWLTGWDAEFVDSRIDPEQFVDLGDRVLVVSRVSGRGRISEAEVEVRTTHLFTLRNGRIADVRAFFDHGAALEAAGVRE
jgi:ketosteroid isomerase-like protein